MNYGMYMSASGVLTGMARQDVLANNLANMNTAAYKTDFAPVMQRATARVEDRLTSLPSNTMLEALGGGVLLAPTRSDFAPAALDPTSNALDIAIDGPGFFVADTGRGAGDQRFRLTRDGRLSLEPTGRLVRAADGLPLVSQTGLPITVDPTLPIAIADDGAVRQGDDEVGRLRLVSPRDTLSLTKEGNGLYAFQGETLPTGGLMGAVRQQRVERSGVDPFTALMGITRAGGAVENNARLLTLHDQALGRAITTLGRVT